MMRSIIQWKHLAHEITFAHKEKCKLLNLKSTQYLSLGFYTRRWLAFFPAGGHGLASRILYSVSKLMTNRLLIGGRFDQPCRNSKTLY
jgi:hypothetical protein